MSVSPPVGWRTNLADSISAWKMKPPQAVNRTLLITETAVVLSNEWISTEIGKKTKSTLCFVTLMDLFLGGSLSVLAANCYFSQVLFYYWHLAPLKIILLNYCKPFIPFLGLWDHNLLLSNHHDPLLLFTSRCPLYQLPSVSSDCHWL